MKLNMKKLIFLILWIGPVLAIAQVHGGVFGGFGYNSLSGDNTGISDDNGWQAGVWVEPMASERLGVYGSLAYAQRGGLLDPDIEVAGEYVVLSVLPRLHLKVPDGSVAFLAGVGGYAGKLTEKAEEDFDAGLVAHVGLEWKRVSMVVFFQRGLMDITELIPGGQRWMSAGIGVGVRLF